MRPTPPAIETSIYCMIRRLQIRTYKIGAVHTTNYPKVMKLHGQASLNTSVQVFTTATTSYFLHLIKLYDHLKCTNVLLLFSVANWWCIPFQFFVTESMPSFFSFSERRAAVNPSESPKHLPFLFRINMSLEPTMYWEKYYQLPNFLLIRRNQILSLASSDSVHWR